MKQCGRWHTVLCNKFYKRCAKYVSTELGRLHTNLSAVDQCKLVIISISSRFNRITAYIYIR